METTLKPCPFCGSSSICASVGSVMCNDCGVPFPYEVWNRRVPDPDLARLQARVAELEAAQQQWECKWHNAADYDLIRDVLDGKPVAPAAGSLAARALAMVQVLRRYAGGLWSANTDEAGYEDGWWTVDVGPGPAREVLR